MSLTDENKSQNNNNEFNFKKIKMKQQQQQQQQGNNNNESDIISQNSQGVYKAQVETLRIENEKLKHLAR